MALLELMVVLRQNGVIPLLFLIRAEKVMLEFIFLMFQRSKMAVTYKSTITMQKLAAEFS
jgi:hypothetical protein